MHRRTVCLAALAVIALAGTAATGPQTLARDRGARVTGPTVQPLIRGHILMRGFDTPPTTAQCRAQLKMSCYAPAQLQQAYDLAPLYAQGLNGAGRTIVIVDSFGSPTIQADLKTFDQAFSLPDPPSLKIIQPAGAVPPFDSNNDTMDGWAGETSLDVEWAHAIAPGANILLVETPTAEIEGSSGFPEIVAAENYVVDNHLGDVISQSFGATEQTFTNKEQLLGLRSAYDNAGGHGVTVLAGSGDEGATGLHTNTKCCYLRAVNSWPSSDPLVTSVGGTKLNLDATGKRLSPDSAWNDHYAASGGGSSVVFGRPSYQDGLHLPARQGYRRSTPDISMSAAVDGGVLVYESYDHHAGWYTVGGTSEASPEFAGIVAIAAQAAGHSLGLINIKLYALGSGSPGIPDVTRGNTDLKVNGNSSVSVTVRGHVAGRGYDQATGLGTVDAAKLVPELAAG